MGFVLHKSLSGIRNHALEADYQSLIQCINTFARKQLRGCGTGTMRQPSQSRTTSLTQTEQQCRWIATMRASDADIIALITPAHIDDCGKDPVSTIATCRTAQLRNAAGATFNDALMMGRMGSHTVLSGIELKHD
jgi:hypothetical protein